MKKILITLLALAGLAVLAFLFRNTLGAFLPSGKQQTAPSVATGISQDKIKIGSSSALTGHASFLGSEYIRGAQAYLNKVNDDGGVNGRKIELIAYDDQYDPAKTVINTQKLINEDQVFALFNYVGTPTGVKVIPLVEQEKVPLIGLFTGADAFRHPFQKYIFNIRASYYQEVGLFIDGVVKELGLTKVAVFYQYDAYGMDGLTGAQIALEKYNLKPVVEASYQRGTLDVEEALQTIKESKAEAVVMIGTYSPMAKFIKLAKVDGFRPIFQNVSFVGSEALLKELGTDGNGVVVTEVVPPPYEKNLLLGVDEYAMLLKKYFPEAESSFGGLEGFANAKIMVEAFKRAGADLNRESFIMAMESINKYDLGLASPVSFSATNHQGMERAYATYIQDGEFVLFSDWQEAKPFISGGN